MGLDVSPGRIKLVGLAAGPGGPVVCCAADETVGGEHGADTRFDAPAIGAAVAEILSRFGVRPRRVALSLGPAEAVSRRLTVVDQEPAHLLAALALQLGQALGADVAFPRVGYSPLPAAAAPGRVTLFAAAARAEAVAAQQRAVGAAGQDQGPVTAAAAALINAWRVCPAKGASAGRVVLLHVGHAAALWIVLDGGEPVALDAPLVGLASMRERSAGRGASAPAGTLSAAVLAEWTGRLRQEIGRGVQPLRRDSAGGHEDGYEVWVSGGGSRVPGFLDALAEGLSVPVRAYDPLREMEWDGEPADVFGPALVPALGAALQALAPAQGTTPLIDVDLRAQGDARGPGEGRVSLPSLVRAIVRDRAYHGLLAAGVALWAATAVLGARMEEASRVVGEREARVLADSAAVAGAMGRSQLLEERRRGLGDRIDAVAALERGRYAWPRLLHGVARSVPGTAWIYEVVGEGDDAAGEGLSVRIRGFAASERVAGDFARSLVRGGAAAEAEVRRTVAMQIGRTPVVQFEVAVRSAAPADVPLPATAGGTP